MNIITHDESPKSKIQVLFERVLMAMVFACVFMQKPEGCLVPAYHFGREVLDPVHVELMYNKERRLQINTSRNIVKPYSNYQEGLNEIPPLKVPLIPLAPIPPYLPGQCFNLKEGIEIIRRSTLRVA